MDTKPDHRYESMQLWLQSFMATNHYSLTPASSDASFRRYFRLKLEEESYIIMDSPPEHEDNQAFLKIALLLEQYGLNVPHVYKDDLNLGFLMLDDLGSESYLSKLTETTADDLYKKAIDCLLTLQKIPTANQPLPGYNKALLLQELALFNEWFLQRHLHLTPPEWLSSVFELLTHNAELQPQVVVHRDYHSRNLMFLSDEMPGVIDFQDAVIGPISYDLVSLLRDVYIYWSPEQQMKWVNYYIEQALHHGLLTSEQSVLFPRWFDFMGLQRHIKILGIFCRLNYRDNKPNYMKDLPVTLKYVYQVCERYPELQQLSQYLAQQPEINAIK